MAMFVAPITLPSVERVRYSAKRLLPEPPRHRRVSKSAPVQTDQLGRVLEEWLSEIKVRYTFDGE
ncbi:MAG TPA: hypothetical protein VFW12_10170 [Candidatus Limnocylindria bacterium]|nr:hypothetical protein [Candidatus Limnocylindria bacterium]